MKKNILYIFNDNRLGGAALSLLDILTKMKECINPVVIVQESINDETYRKFEELDLCCCKIRFSTDYVPVGEVTDEKKEEEFRQSYEAALQLLPIIKREKIHLVHINSSVSYFAALAALMADIPYVWHIRELMEEQFGCEFLDNRLKFELYSRADKLIAISDFVSQKYYDKFLLKTTKMYNGLNIERFKIGIDETQDFENVFLVAAAVISVEKGQMDAIKAVEILINKGYADIKLIIVGGGNDNYIWALKKYIKKKEVEDNVCILPFRYDLSDVRRKVSYEIVCSQNEALGRVTVEAMLAGNFVIGAKSGGTTEIIGEHEERGYLYELHDSGKLADAMERAIKTSRYEKKKIVKSAQAYAEDTFDSQKYCSELLQMYDEAVNSFESKYPVNFLQKQKERYALVQNKKVFNSQGSDNRVLKLQAAFNLSIKWLDIKQKGHNLAEYFMRNNMESVAIYGMASLGQRLYDELEDNGVTIKYLIDREPGRMNRVLEFVTLNERKLDVDVIVVTVAGAERKIVEEIKSLGYGNVIGLTDVLNELCE